MAGYFDSAWARVDRADAHLRAIMRRVRAFENSNTHTVTKEEDPSANEVFFDVRYRRSPPRRWDSLVADCIHNYRSALDHAIWVICDRYGTTNRSRTFPICLKRSEYRDNLRRYVGNTGRCGAKAIIESFQPYKAGRLGDHDPLWLAHELDRFAKHRVLGELVLRFARPDLDVASPPGSPDVAFEYHRDGSGPDDGKTMVVHVRVFSHPIAVVKMHLTPIVGIGLLQPHLNHPGPVPLVRTLIRIGEEVQSVIGELEPVCENP
jgi:hypothetical protein